MGSPEHRRTPTDQSTSAAPLPLPPNPAPITFEGRTYSHLPQELAAQMAAVSSFPAPPQHCGHPSATFALAPPPVSYILMFLFLT
jgi:hypothetical protein